VLRQCPSLSPILHNCNAAGPSFLAAPTRRLTITGAWIARSVLRAVLAGTAVRGVGLHLTIARQREAMPRDMATMEVVPATARDRTIQIRVTPWGMGILPGGPGQ
jgi:hypothetical protein